MLRCGFGFVALRLGRLEPARGGCWGLGTSGRGRDHCEWSLVSLSHSPLSFAPNDVSCLASGLHRS